MVFPFSFFNFVYLFFLHCVNNVWVDLFTKFTSLCKISLGIGRNKLDSRHNFKFLLNLK